MIGKLLNKMDFNTYGVQVGAADVLPDCLTVIVTGAASGIGLAQSQQFLEEGHQVFALDLADKEGVFPSLQEIYPSAFSYMLADLSEEDQVDKAFNTFKKHFDQLNVLCNTAGKLDDYKNMSETSFSDWELILKNNVNSVFLMTKKALPLLLEKPSSRIVNMASIAGLTAGGGGISYTAAKHAIVGITKQMAYDYSAQGLRVNAIAPGVIATRMNEKDFSEDSGKMAAWVAGETPVKRWARAEEIAELTLFLASNKADYIQGTVIPVDGGWMVR